MFQGVDKDEGLSPLDAKIGGYHGTASVPDCKQPSALIPSAYR